MNPAFAWLALVYAGSVALGRHLGLRLPWRTAIFLYLIVLAFLWRPLTGAWVVAPADFLQTLYPWRATIEGQVRNEELNDVILQMVPWAHQVRESWKDLRPPLWNDAAGVGYPLLANGQSAALSPFRLINLPLDLGAAMASEAAMKLLIAASFTWLLLRRRGCSEAAATVGAVSFAFSTFMIVWLNFPHVTVTAILPMVVYGVDLLAERVSARRFAFMSAAFFLILAGGHPESAAHVIVAAGLWLLLLLWLREANWRTLGWICAAGIAGLLLAAPVVLPLLEALPHSQRMDWLREGAHFEAPFDLKVFIPMLLHPSFFGLIRDQTIWGPGIAEVVCGYAGVLALTGWIALTVQFIRRRRRDWRLYPILAFPLAGAIAAGVPGIRHLFEMIPLFSLAANGRLRLVVCFAGALAVAGLVDMLRGERRIVGVSAATVLTLLAAFLLFWPYPGAEARYNSWLDATPRLLTAGAVAAVAFAGLSARMSHLLILCTVLVDLWWFALPWNPVVRSHQLFEATSLIHRLVALDKAHEARGPSRIAGMTGTFFPNSAAMFGLQDIRAHDPMALGRPLGMLRVFTGYTSDEYFGMLKYVDHPILDFLNVRWLVSAPDEAVAGNRFTLIHESRDGRIWENPAAADRFFGAPNVHVVSARDQRLEVLRQSDDWIHDVVVERLPSALPEAVRRELVISRAEAPARVRVLDYSPGSATIETSFDRWTLLATSVPDYPGWKILRDGERLHPIRINEAFLGAVVPPGRSTIEVRYSPRSFQAGVLLSALVALLIFGFVLNESRSARTKTAPRSL